MIADIAPPFRSATPEDAPDLARFVNMAGDGMPLYLWKRMAGPGQSAWDVGCARARRDSGAFSWRNAILRMVGDEPVACLIGYPLEDNPAPTDYSTMPPMFEPLQRLEDMAPRAPGTSTCSPPRNHTAAMATAASCWLLQKPLPRD